MQTERWDKYAESLDSLTHIYAKRWADNRPIAHDPAQVFPSGDATKCAETLQKYVDVCKQHLGQIQVRKDLKKKKKKQYLIHCFEQTGRDGFVVVSTNLGTLPTLRLTPTPRPHKPKCDNDARNTVHKKYSPDYSRNCTSTRGIRGRYIYQRSGQASEALGWPPAGCNSSRSWL